MGVASSNTMDEIARLPASHWISLGNSQEHAIAMTQLNATLIQATSRLIQSSQTAAESATKLVIGIGIDDYDAEGSLLPDASLLPLWKELADALVKLSINESLSIDLFIYNIQLPTWMLSMLEPALKAAPIKSFWLGNNRLGSDGINFVTRVLEENHSLTKLILWKNEIEIECGHAVLSLVEAARNHPVLDWFGFVECGISRILPIVPEIVPALLSLHKVSLVNNDLGSHAASLISSCLATNPSIKRLDLRGNLFNDDDARLFANSPRTNTNLIVLNLRDTDSGLKTLYKSVYDEQSINTIFESNHTCELKLFDDDAQIPNGIDKAVLSMNGTWLDPDIFPESLLLRCERAANGNASVVIELLQIEGRKKMKILHAIQGGNAGHIKMHLLKDIPVEIMPKVLAFLQESGKYDETEESSLNRLFQVIRARQEVMSFHSVADGECDSSKPKDHCRRLTPLENFDQKRTFLVALIISSIVVMMLISGQNTCSSADLQGK